MTRPVKLFLIALCLGLLGLSCQQPSEPIRPVADLDDAILERHASIGPFEPRAARVLTDNDEAFAEKLRLVEGARSSIEMLYFIFHQDATSSVLAKALLAAADRGVDVRLIVDYNTNYKDLDLYTMLESEASAGPGSVQIRFYNRPTRRIVEDAIYLTIGCSDLGGDDGETQRDCDQRKLEFIDRALAEEDIEPAGRISNLNLGYSGLFLSGLYGRNPGAIARAIIEGQNLDLEALKGQASGERIESLKKLARTHWRSRQGPVFTRLVGKIQLALAYLFYGGEIRELRDTVTALLPVTKSAERGGWQDWEFQSDYLHQKLLLVDGERVLTGGRNIGDSYHVRDPRDFEHSLLGKYPLFADTEISMELPPEQGRKFRQVFDQLWDFRQMVATSAEVRKHAPNDFIANLAVAKQACEAATDDQRDACVERELETGVSLQERHAARHQEVLRLAARYEQDYQPAAPEDRSPTFEVDGGARAYYLENIPYDKNVAPADRERLYGAQGLQEDASGKYLHLLWRRGMTHTCSTSSAEAPKRVILLNPYYLPPAPLLRAAGWMVDGTLDCRHVSVQVLTNSYDTNNFKVINPLAHVGLKAFSEFYHQQGDPEKRAEFDFYEYREKPGVNFTLHSKVSVLGDSMIIGSANIDARSYLMDANNGILLRDAPGLRDSYTRFLDQQLEDPEIVEKIDDYLRSHPLDEIKTEKLQQLNDYLASLAGDEYLSPEQLSQMDRLFRLVLDQVYELTHRVLQGDEKAIDDYNRLLKFL